MIKTYEVLIFPEGVSQITGRVFRRDVLANFVSVDHKPINVVSEFTANLGKTDLSRSLGFVTDFVLKEGGVYGTFRPLANYQNIYDTLEKEGVEIKPRLAASYCGKVDSRTKEVTDIELIEFLDVGFNAE